MQLRKVRTLVIALLAAATLWSSASFAQTITLDMPSWQATEPGTSDWFKELIAAFEAMNPGVKIEFTHEPFAGYNDKMVTRFAAGNPPDILHLPAANFTIYAQEGWLEPLDARMAASNSAVLTEWTPVQEGCGYQGQTLCVIVLGYGYVLGWNEAAFNEVGLSGPPTNSAEPIEYAKRLTIDRDGDGTIDQYGFVFPTVTHAGVETHATTFLFEADPNGHWLDAEGNLNRDAAKTAWAVLKQLVDDGSVPLGVDNNGKRQFFVEGRSAMMLEGPHPGQHQQRRAGDPSRPARRTNPDQRRDLRRRQQRARHPRGSAGRTSRAGLGVHPALHLAGVAGQVRDHRRSTPGPRRRALSRHPRRQREHEPVRDRCRQRP